MDVEVQRREETVGNLRGGRIQARKTVKWVIVNEGKDVLTYNTMKEAREVAQGILDRQTYTDANPYRGRRQIVCVRRTKSKGSI